MPSSGMWFVCCYTVPCPCIRISHSHHSVVVVTALLYKAPEILRQLNHAVVGTKPADIYSFGIIMQEIVTLVRPYQAITNEEPKGKHIIYRYTIYMTAHRRQINGSTGAD